MNTNVGSRAVVFVVSLIMLALAGCQPAAPDTNRNAELATASPEPVVDRAVIEAELMKLERDWLAAAQSHNPEPVRGIVADDAVLVYPDGMLATKADELRFIETSAVTADSWEMVDTKVTVIDANAAFISGRSIVKNGKYNDPNTKKPVDISGEYRFIDVYAKRDGKWQVVASHATKILAPAPAASPMASPARPSPTPTRTTSPTP